MGRKLQAKKRYDYIVVGAGSAGCVLASRLSEMPNVSVALVEAGPIDKGWKIHMPLAVENLISTETYNWAYESEPEAQLKNRRISHPRGRVLGGSSSINGMVYTRGHALDYENWASKYGCAGWDYASVLPYFKKAESRKNGDPVYRGTAGPLHVQKPDLSKCPVNDAFMKAGKQAGYPVTDDSNAFSQEGFGPNEATIHGGERWSTASAYLGKEVRDRPNLTVITNALVTKITLKDKVATGICLFLDNEEHHVLANKEVILCGGAFNSPQLLQLSGIGPRETLKAAGVPVLHELPGVGENLQDHPDLALKYKCRVPAGLGQIIGFPRKQLTGISWFLNRKGPASSNQFEAAAYIRTRAGIKHPNLKLEMLPLAFQADTFTPYPGYSFQIHMTQLRADSRGSVKIKSRDPKEKPTISFNYLSVPNDLQVFRDAVKLTREIVAQSAFEHLRGEELEPGLNLTDAQLDEWIRSAVATAFHPSGTCRMGKVDDPLTVVDAQLKVVGISNLRVADTSVMPEVVSSNTNAPTIMIGERAADLIRQRNLSAIIAPFYVNERWQTAQR